ncbi:SIMPL domain-containing protein [Fluviicola sp.]|uniref:SIMPL domain-containing protein n=1 Tax=Fluviicola sp. TaxID=1917219 RepID=UPI0031DB8F15
MKTLFLQSTPQAAGFSLRKLCFLFLFLTSGIVFGQTEHTSKPTVTVNGTAKGSIVPDMTELNIHLSSVKMNMADATKAIGDQTQQFLKILKQLGFQESDVKTTNYAASKNRIYRQNGPVDSGYVVSQNLTVKFAYNQATLQKIAARFSESKDPVDFTIGFYLSDALREKTEADLQGKAVADARKKATNLAAAAGVKLAAVKSIIYGVDNAGPVYYKAEMRAFADSGMSDGADLRFAPQEMELQESVTLIWFLE